MKREHLLAYLRVAGYHDDAATYTRLLIENRISKAAAKEAYSAGVKARENGVPCDCRTCKVERARAGANARQAAMSANFGKPPAAIAREQVLGAHSESALEIKLHAEVTKSLAPPTLVSTHPIHNPRPGGPYVTHHYSDGGITFGCTAFPDESEWDSDAELGGEGG